MYYKYCLLKVFECVLGMIFWKSSKLFEMLILKRNLSKTVLSPSFDDLTSAWGFNENACAFSLTLCVEGKQWFDCSFLIVLAGNE